MQDITNVIKEGKDEKGNALSGDLALYHVYFSKQDSFTAFRLEGPNSRGELVERIYVQEPLSVFLKEEFGEVITDFFEQFVDGRIGIDLREIFKENSFRPAIAVPTNPEEVEALVGDDNTIQMIQGILKVLRKLPALQKQVICIALGVPEGERKWATQIIEGPVSRGGISESQLEELIINFMRQNSKAVRDFFSESADRIATVFREEVLGRTDQTVEGTARENQPLEPDSTGTMPSNTTLQPSVSTPES